MQLELPWRSEEALQRELEERTGLRLNIIITDNTSTMLSLRFDRGRRSARLRLHQMFLRADPKIIRALAEWLTRPRAAKSGRVIDRFIEQNCHHIRPIQPRPDRLQTQGAFFDLRVLYDEVNGIHFEGQVTAAITWGRMPARSRRRRRSIRFGSYTQEDHLVRIHPLLDQEFVPHYVVRYIVFHEMLHAFLGVGISPTGRRLIHTPQFRRMELTYPDYDEAIAWVENPRNLSRLLAPVSV